MDFDPTLWTILTALEMFHNTTFTNCRKKKTNKKLSEDNLINFFYQILIDFINISLW